jgi:hypothetical protein
MAVARGAHVLDVRTYQSVAVRNIKNATRAMDMCVPSDGIEFMWWLDDAEDDVGGVSSG